jgi:hypothetical protein
MTDAYQMQDQRTGFLDSVHGAIFFGVPNQGMETAALESAARDQPNRPLLVSLQRDSDFLTKQSRDFDAVIKDHDLDMIYFYESRLTEQLVEVSC